DRDIPIIASSANVFSDSSQNSHTAGADVFLSKPIDVGQLLSHLQALLKLEWQYQSAIAASDKTRVNTDALSEGGDRLNNEPPKDDQPLIVPAPEAMAKLHDLAMRGHLKGILKEAEQLRQTPKLVPFADQIKALAQSFREKELLALISQYQNH
ncbi:MAG: hypothetical protein AAGF98_13235, partial [Cyanobacteria bacterium P01_H01_bin.153]